MTRWTESQLAAIERDGELLVSAAAGSGKTAVMTERIARLVSGGEPLDGMLVVTYTRAAAAEMKKRIAARLNELAQQSGDPRLFSAALDVGRAGISTIHSFCAQVLRRHFAATRLDPSFRICDDARVTMLKADALDDMLEARLSETPSFIELQRAAGGEEKLRRLILTVYDFMFAQPDPFGWLDGAAAAYSMDEAALEASGVPEILLRSAKEELTSAAEQLHALRDEIYYLPAVCEKLDAELASLRAACMQRTCDGYKRALSGVAFCERLTFPKGTDDSIKTPVLSARTKLIKPMVKRQLAAFSRPLSHEVKRLNALAPLMGELAETMRDFTARYGALKRARQLIDYQDMEQLTLKVLGEPHIAREYRERFDHIFVDEYQDINRVQRSIFDRIQKPGSMFAVGDVKQSIYRFRMADPSLFMERAKQLSGTGLIELNENFRSASGVIDCVNAVFSRIMSEDCGEIAYDEHASLRAFRTESGGAELTVISSHDRPDTGDPPDSTEAEALYAAGRIKQLMQSGTLTDRHTGLPRAYRYSDFAILGRSIKRSAERIAQTLAACGIPAYADVTGGYFSALEVRLLMELLRVIDNRRENIPLASVLRSPIGGFDTPELITLRLMGDGDVIDLLEKAAEEITPLGEKSRRILSRLSAWREDSRLISLEQLVCRLVDDTGYYDYVSALPGARRANLDAFIDRAREFDELPADLHSFITHMDRVKDADALGAAQTGGADVVRILSIHRSKGLEFPVVILTGLNRRFNRSDTQADFVCDESGIGVRRIHNNRKQGCILHDAISVTCEKKELAEEMRVLYVGMTRARERLIMTGSAANPSSLIKKCSAAPTPALVARARSPMELLLMGLMATRSGNALRAELGLGGAATGPDLPIRICPAAVQDLFSPRISERDYRAFTQMAYDTPSPYDASFDWSYPYLADTLLPGKVSVSGLAGNRIDMRRRPDFVAAPLSAPDRGTAAHALMQHISIASHDAASASAELAACVESGLLTQAQADTVEISAITRFFASALGGRLIASPRVERELEFLVSVPASELLDAPTAQPILLQGIIDCCFIENGGWVIIDYKTDRYAPGGAAAAAARHARQLMLYALALERMTHIPVLEKHIYFLHGCESVKVE